MLKEFREFVMRGNVLDMAVGVIIGVAFGAIVTSLVRDIIMPPIGLGLGKVDCWCRNHQLWGFHKYDYYIYHSCFCCFYDCPNCQQGPPKDGSEGSSSASCPNNKRLPVLSI